MKKTERERAAVRRQTTNIVRANGKLLFRKKRRTEHTLQCEDLSDDDWIKISALTPLPDDARFRIAGIIAMYRNRAAADRGSLATKRRVLRMRNAIRRLLNDAETLKEDPVFFNVSLPIWSSRTGPNIFDIDKRVRSISELDQILADAQERMQLKRGRKSSKPLEGLIKNLVWIQADATRKYVKRSTKSGSLRPINAFVSACAKIADPTLSQSNVESVLTKCIAEHHHILKHDGFDTAVGEYVRSDRFKN